MLFNSYIFIFIFLPLVVIGYFLINHFKKYELAKAYLLGMSLWFYGYFNWKYVLIIVSSVLINFAFFKVMKKQTDERKTKALMVVDVAINIGILIWFKYMDFMISNVNALFKTDFALLRIALPLGISFFTFQQISFIVDTYRGTVPDYGFLSYACYVTFFPQLIAGPIVTHDELVPQLEDVNKKKVNWENMGKGIYMFTLGLAKKVLIADIFGGAVDYGFSVYESLDSLSAIFVMLGYTFQMYFDFSGYCDMAIGLGKMFNFELPINFDSPYKSMNISEYWDRWHMTLTRFFTSYIYMPITIKGVRKGKKKLYGALVPLLVFLISGFWHGANWTFVAWGVMHGIALVIYNTFKKTFKKMHPALNWLITFTFVNVALLFFRSDTISQAILMVRKVFCWGYGPINTVLRDCFRTTEFKHLLNIFADYETNHPNTLMALYYTVTMFIVLGTKNTHERMEKFKPTVTKCFTTTILLVWCIISLTGISKFLYFNF